MRGEGCSRKAGGGTEGRGRRGAGPEAELTCLAQSSLLRLSPSCSSSRSRLTLSSSFCSCRPCQGRPQTYFSALRAGVDLLFPTHPSGGPTAPPKWTEVDAFYSSPSLQLSGESFTVHCNAKCASPPDLESVLNLSDPAPRLFLIGE